MAKTDKKNKKTFILLFTQLLEKVGFQICGFIGEFQWKFPTLNAAAVDEMMRFCGDKRRLRAESELGEAASYSGCRETAAEGRANNPSTDEPRNLRGGGEWVGG